MNLACVLYSLTSLWQQLVDAGQLRWDPTVVLQPPNATHQVKLYMHGSWFPYMFMLSFNYAPLHNSACNLISFLAAPLCRETSIVAYTVTTPLVTTFH